jgi:hypothetical protein
VIGKIKVKFLPSNLTSEVQPLDQGIMRAVKSQYYQQMLQYIVTIAETNNTKSEFNKSVSVLHAVRWFSSAWEEISRAVTVKSFQEGFNNHQEKTEDCEEGTGLNQGACYLLLVVEKVTASADEIEGDDTDLTLHEEVPSTPDEVLEDIFKEMEEQNKTHIVKLVTVTITVTCRIQITAGHCLAIRKLSSVCLN